jgi:hypothetical protein
VEGLGGKEEGAPQDNKVYSDTILPSRRRQIGVSAPLDTEATFLTQCGRCVKRKVADSNSSPTILQSAPSLAVAGFVGIRGGLPGKEEIEEEFRKGHINVNDSLPLPTCCPIRPNLAAIRR